MILFPCNQFGGKEFKRNEEVFHFAVERNRFKGRIMSIGDVTGKNASPCWRFLKENVKGAKEVKGNFKGIYLVSKHGIISQPSNDLEEDIIEFLDEEDLPKEAESEYSEEQLIRDLQICRETISSPDVNCAESRLSERFQDIIRDIQANPSNGRLPRHVISDDDIQQLHNINDQNPSSNLDDVICKLSNAQKSRMSVNSLLVLQGLKRDYARAPSVDLRSTILHEMQLQDENQNTSIDDLWLSAIQDIEKEERKITKRKKKPSRTPKSKACLGIQAGSTGGSGC